jgi:serine/threonine protein kinase
LKPENDIVRNDGVVKIVDFGLAKLFGPSEPSPADDALRKLATSTRARRKWWSCGCSAA